MADQDPSRIANLLERHVHKVMPRGVKVTIDTGNHGANPYLIPPDHRGLQVAGSVLREVYGREPYRIRMGGTIPANAMFLQLLGANTIVFAFGLEDEHQHSPNEFFRLSSYDRGQRAYGKLLSQLGE